MIPEISASSREEREAFIKEHFACRSDCDSCGICAVYHGLDPLLVYHDYIDGIREYLDIVQDYR